MDKFNQIKSRLTLICCLLSVVFVFSACKDDKTDTNTRTAEDAISAVSIIYDIFNQIDAIAKDSNYHLSKSKNSDLTSCMTVISSSDNSFPKLVTLDFGATNCLGSDGKNRRGKILFNISGKYYDQTTSISVAFSNYYINDSRIEGKYTLENTGRNILGNLTHSITIKDFYIYTTSGTISFNGSFIREWTAGESTAWPVVNDDEFQITGSGSGTSSGSENFSLKIISSLKYKVGCSWFNSGIMNVSPYGRSVRMIDFGSGNCDNSVKITIDGNISTIYLR
ncbi:MAG: hypothetical protein Q8880_02300 [Bacteroidota bacterium]|nr:hypothetical protein [Bacteroidota bacterium]